MEIKSDEKLIYSYIQGEEKALEELIGRYLPLIFGFARKYTGNPDTAADIAQETFVKVWKNIRKFKQTEKFRPWVFTIAKNTALDWLRKREDISLSAFEDKETGELKLDFAEQNLEDSIDIKNRAKKAEGILFGLPENYKTVIFMHDEEELTFKEIAEALKEPLNTVKSRYRRAMLLARKELKQLLKP